MNIFKFSVGSEAKRVAVRCVFAIGVVCWANSPLVSCSKKFLKTILCLNSILACLLGKHQRNL